MHFQIWVRSGVNPLYDWAKMENSDFGWWRMRMANSARLYDIIRIDHFLGIIKYYTIPYEMPDARQGSYEHGPGQKLLDAINESIGDKKIIAEDLGVCMPEVDQILKDNNYPGMRCLNSHLVATERIHIFHIITLIIVYATVEHTTMKHFLDFLMTEMMAS